MRNLLTMVMLEVAVRLSLAVAIEGEMLIRTDALSVAEVFATQQLCDIP